jgi:hypothetical protein
VDREVWEHFGSEERIGETLRLLVDIAKKRPAQLAAPRCTRRASLTPAGAAHVA